MEVPSLKIKVETDLTDVERLCATLKYVDELRKNLGLTKRQIRKMVKYKISTARF